MYISRCSVQHCILTTLSELSFKSGNFTVVENEGSVEVCVILTAPLDTVVDTIVRSSAGSATSGTVVEKGQNVVDIRSSFLNVCFCAQLSCHC